VLVKNSGSSSSSHGWREKFITKSMIQFALEANASCLLLQLNYDECFCSRVCAMRQERGVKFINFYIGANFFSSLFIVNTSVEQEEFFT
jgi:hypothetical protein